VLRRRPAPQAALLGQPPSPSARRTARRRHGALLRGSAPRAQAARCAPGEATQQRLPLTILDQLDRTHLSGQPHRQMLLVGAGDPPKSELRPDLHAVVLLRVGLEKSYCANAPESTFTWRRTPPQLREDRPPAAESRPRARRTSAPARTTAASARVVGHQQPVSLDQRPARDQILKLPLPTHDATLSNAPAPTTTGYGGCRSVRNLLPHGARRPNASRTPKARLRRHCHGLNYFSAQDSYPCTGPLWWFGGVRRAGVGS
jgi:hypothetical protein